MGRYAFTEDRQVRLQVSSDVSVDQWQDIADRCPYATFFHSPHWHMAFSRSYPGIKIATKLFRFDDGRAAVFPLLERKTLFGLSKIYESTAEGCYGGWISSDKMGPPHAKAMTEWILHNCRNIIWRVNPFDEKAQRPDSLEAQGDTTEILHLDGFESEESLLRHYKHSVRKQIGKAKRANLQVRLARGWREWEAYFDLYQLAMKRWGRKAFVRYPLELFRYFFELQTPRVKLWAVTSSDRVVGGNLNFYQSRHSVEWHAAFDSEYFALGARNFLVHNIIVDALREGYAYYDFNPSGPLEGSRKFKQTFGTTSVPANIIVREYGLQRIRIPRTLTRVGRRLRLLRR